MRIDVALLVIVNQHVFVVHIQILELNWEKSLKDFRDSQIWPEGTDHVQIVVTQCRSHNHPFNIFSRPPDSD